MSSDWRPRDTTPGEDAQALFLAVGTAAAVGAVTFWLTRTLLGRDRIRLDPPVPGRGEAPTGEPPRIGSGAS
jgi:hypothetical protein